MIRCRLFSPVQGVDLDNHRIPSPDPQDWFRDRYVTQVEWDPILGTLLELLGKGALSALAG